MNDSVGNTGLFSQLIPKPYARYSGRSAIHFLVYYEGFWIHHIPSRIYVNYENDSPKFKGKIMPELYVKWPFQGNNARKCQRLHDWIIRCVLLDVRRFPWRGISLKMWDWNSYRFGEEKSSWNNLYEMTYSVG